MNSTAEPPRTGAVLAALVAAEVLSSFELTLVYSALGAMLKEYRDPALIAWILTAFTLVSASVVLLCGRFGDLWGRRKVLLVVLALSGIGSTISALSTTLTGVLVGRIIQGFSSSILALCFGLVREHFPPEKVVMGTGILIVTANVTGAMGYVLGGYIVDHFSWHGIFHVSALVAYVAFFMVWKLLPPGRTTAPSQGRFDYLGAVLFVPGIVAILLSISHWRQWQGGVLPPWLILACGLAIVAAWLWHELRVRQPLVNVHLLANRQVVFTILCLAFMCAGPMSYGMIIPMLLTQPAWNIPGAGLTAMQASYVISIPVLLGLIGALACAPLVRTVGARATMIMAAGLMSASWIALTTAHDTPWQIGLLLTPMCIGSAITLAVIPVLYNEVVPLDHTSETNGMGGLFRQIAVSIGHMAIGLILRAQMVADPAGGGSVPAPDSFTRAIALVAVLSLVMLACALALPRRAVGLNMAQVTG
jgi:MFS family permease